jgi:hypothetical protein
VGWLVVDPHCNVTLPTGQFSPPHQQLFYAITQAIQAGGQHRERPVSRRAGSRRFWRWTAAGVLTASA